MPAIPLMKDFAHYGELANEYLLQKVCLASKMILLPAHKNCRYYGNEYYRKVKLTEGNYNRLISVLIDVLNRSNARQTPKNVNVFTTNYDMFIEKAVSNVIFNKRFIFNDGSSGYFDRVLNMTNYNRVVAYRGLNDNYLSEIPSLNLIKPHGSVNWENVRKDERILIREHVLDDPMVVMPNGLESQETFLSNHFHEMLRVFQIELDKPQSVLLVLGFSFQDSHIAKMVRRALQNPELMVYVFAYSDGTTKSYVQNLGLNDVCHNLKVIEPNELGYEHLTISELSEILSISIEEQS